MRAAGWLLVCGCVTAAPAPVAPGPARVVAAPAPVVDAGPPGWTDAEVAERLALNCQSCHSLAYVGQQRLTQAQWVGTLTKMRGWGALLEEAEVPPLAEALARAHPATGPVPAFAVQEVTLFAPEAPLPGDAARGKVVFDTRCLACHGADARGSIGVNLGDRPLLQQPTRFAAFVKTGRGRMPPQADLSEAQLGDLLAFLRTQ